MSTLELIKTFCGTDETRAILMQPFTRDGWTWATDGRIMVRVPVIPEVPETDAIPSISEVFASNPEVPLHDPVPVPDAKEPQDCTMCGATGYVYCPYCQHFETCKNCDGTGKTAFDNRYNRWQRIDGQPFACRYTRLVMSLPGAKIGVGTVKGLPYMLFSFDGGSGILLGLDEHNGIVKPLSGDEWKPTAKDGEEGA